MHSKQERLAVFYSRLAAAPPASSAAEAFALVVSTFVAVEDMLCVQEADRMHPPSGDFWFRVEGRADLDLYRQKEHDTIIGANGAILIRLRRTTAIQCSKPGMDGQEVTL